MTYAVFTQEPFNLPVAAIRRMTDWQLVHLYYRPARKAARERERTGGAQPTRGGEGGGKVQSREQFVGFHAGQFPETTLDYWHAQYDAFLSRLGLPPDRPTPDPG